jgi:hypothetical protein
MLLQYNIAVVVCRPAIVRQNDDFWEQGSVDILL